jgi:hypothetical protein
MALQSVTNISVDFCDKKYIMVNAKQNDKKSRFLLVSCYNHGEFYPINTSEHSAFVRYKKSDGYSVFNVCNITNDKKILVELTEQMLASAGICYADLVIANRGGAKIDVNTGKIVAIDNASILSTMTFCIDVSETTVDNSEIESSYEFDGLNIALEEAVANYQDVILSAKSWTIGDTGKRPNENTDNAKYYYEQCRDKEVNISENATNAAKSETNAKSYMDGAKTSEANAKAYRDNAQTYMNNAEGYMNNAKISETNTKTSETNAKTSETNAEGYKNESYDYSVLAQRYAVGGTNTEENEDIDNAKYYYEQCRDAIIGNAVIGIKGDNETDYRKGNVNITADNVGAIPSTDIATVDEIKTYLSI